MNAVQAARILGVRAGAPWDDVRRAYRDRIRTHHPDTAGDASAADAARIIEAFRTLDHARRQDGAGAPPGSERGDGSSAGPPPPPPPPPPPSAQAERSGAGGRAWSNPSGLAPPVARLDADTLAVAAPADETFRWLVEAAHDIGEITYLDRSGPILEVLCRFEGEPATSLMITIQGRATGTEAFCTTESIEARPGPPTAAVVDLLELAFRRRQDLPPT